MSYLKNKLFLKISQNRMKYQKRLFSSLLPMFEKRVRLKQLQEVKDFSTVCSRPRIQFLPNSSSLSYLSNKQNCFSTFSTINWNMDQSFPFNTHHFPISYPSIKMVYQSKFLLLLRHRPLTRSYSKKYNDNLSSDSDDDKVVRNINPSSSNFNVHHSAKEDSSEKDPWVQSLLADMKKDIDLGKESALSYPIERKEPSNFDLSKNDASSTFEEYDYRLADDVEEFGYYDGSEIVGDIRPEKELPISLKRSKTGVFELEELTTLLEFLGAQNIVSVPVPPEANYCDHMVVVTAKSKRHLKALNEEMAWVHKRKKWNKDPFLLIEGLKTNDRWCAMDIGNLVLHIFSNEEIRDYYDIESLWRLGPENDPKCINEQQESFVLSPEEMFWLESKTEEVDTTVNANSTGESDTSLNANSTEEIDKS